MERNSYEIKERWDVYDNLSEAEFILKEAIKRLIPSDVKSILDIGCGVGSISNDLDNLLVIQIDFSSTALKRAKKERIMGDAGNLPFRANSFEMIILTELLEHLDDTIFENCIKEIIRLDPSIILVSTPFQENLKPFFSRCSYCGAEFHIGHHQRSLKPEDIDFSLEGYKRDFFQLLTPTIELSPIIIILQRKFGAYIYDKNDVCTKCGKKIIPPPILLRMIFGFLRMIDLKIIRLFHKKSYYHMILRYHKKSFDSD